MKLALVATLAVLASFVPAHAGAAPGPVQGLTAERAPGQPLRWTWDVTPGADRYDIVSGALPVADVANATCRTALDADPTDLAYDDIEVPLPGTGLYLLVRAGDTTGGGAGTYDSFARNEGRVNTSCSTFEAYFCVSDATGDSFVMKLTEFAKIVHARDVVRGFEQEVVHVGALSTGGRVPWNPGWQFHIPPEAVYFFDQQIEVCDASIAAVNLGGPPRGSWCPWTSQIESELLHPDRWENGTPAPFYCGPLP